MIIDDTTYSLPIDNYVSEETVKKQIIIGHTFNHDMRHFSGWLHRYHGKFKRTAPFTINQSGTIYQHFDPKFYSRFFNKPDLDNKTIVILLENDGWLIKDTQKNEFITWNGDIYKQSSEVVDKKWRGYNYWSPYSNNQIDTTINLVKKLCNEFSIPLKSIKHNTKIDDLGDYEGVLYRSNLEKHYTDLSPALDFEEFKNKLEIN